MARALWKGVISFGLVNIPVELHTAIREHRPRFRLLHAKDKSPVRYERICQREGNAIAWDDLVKGYEYEKGKFVVLTKDDFQTATIEKTQAIDVVDFVKQEQIDDRFFDIPYYVVPARGGDRGYAVLREAIRESGCVGIGKIVLREAQHLAALTVVGDVLVLTLMRYADELVDAGQFKVPGTKGVRPKELELAKMLVANLAADWDPEKYSDDYRANLLRVIKAKLNGKTADTVASEAPEHSAVVDLMDRLRRSLEARHKSRSTRKKSKTGSRRAA